MLHISPSIQITTKIHLNLPLLKEENRGVLLPATIYKYRCETLKTVRCKYNSANPELVEGSGDEYRIALNVSLRPT